ncbi:MAG: uridine kinase [bacterium]|nr:uridine kinase [bacterium]
MVIGISGGSASGKTTFTEALVQALEGVETVVLNQDRYFRDWELLPPEKREVERTSNHPRAILWDGLVAQVADLKAGRSICTPIEGTRGYRLQQQTTVEPADLVIVEGHLVFWEARLRDLMDVKIFMEVDDHERVLRRMVRDTQGGRRGLDKAVAWYRRDVIPNYSVYTAPTREFADLIVPYEGDGEKAIEVVVTGIRQILRAD